MEEQMAAFFSLWSFSSGNVADGVDATVPPIAPIYTPLDLLKGLCSHLII
jgi:hypothetical protein